MNHKPTVERGQGLVEYALVLVLVAVVVIVILAMMGTSTQQAFCQVAVRLGAEVPDDVCDVVTITQANYSSSDQRLLLKATYNGGAKNGVGLTASPGGAMTRNGKHYQIEFNLSSCPCTVTVTAGTGASDSVEVR
jgi:pilus assembly protein Flp/PilA